MATKINLSNNEIPADSAREVKKVFDNYFTKPLSFPANEVDAVIGFFESRDFDPSAAKAVATVLLTQSKLDNVGVFQLIDTLKGLNSVQLSAVVTEVLNYNRQKISTLGFRVVASDKQFESRNIMV